MSHVAIIGAGLSGLSLALALHKQNISCVVYESRPDAPLNIGGAIMLSPNALRILDRLDVYERIKPLGYNFARLDYRNAETDQVTEVQEFGGEEKYGYDALRIYRTELIDTLLAMLEEKNIAIKYGHKFTHVISETAQDVTVAFANGTQETAKLVIGADGIHSTVRKYLYPDLVPGFIGMAGITAAVPTSQLQAPPDLHLPVTYVLPSKGAFVMAPQQADGSEIIIGKQRRLARDLSRAEIDKFAADKDEQVHFLQSNNEGFPQVVHNAASHISHKKMNIWPFYVVPKLDHWASTKQGRVIILGDAAHAIPPSAGQGINQAFEDVYLLSLLLGAAKGMGTAEGDPLMQDGVKFWQSHRQERVDKVLELNKQIDLRRLPQGEGQAKSDAPVEKLSFDLRWLYNDDIDVLVGDWLQKRQ